MTNPTAAETRWGPGPWSGEPDRDQWTDPDTGLLCLAIRFPRTGHWCGYVAVPEGHPWHRVDYVALPSLNVHWGVNYSHHGDQMIGWHTDREDGNWWVGFSCDHIDDLTPQEMTADDVFAGLREGVYRDLRFVRRECERLAGQIGENL